MDNLLEIRDLSLHIESDHGSNEIFNSKKLNIYPDEIIGILGATGSGKTLFMQCIAGLISHDLFKITGKIQYHFSDFNKSSDELNDEIRQELLKSKIGYVFQFSKDVLNPNMRVGKQVLESFLISQKLNKDEGKSEIIKLFDELNFENSERIYQSYPFQLSGGQIQRILIAIAIIKKPELIIADEPTSSLDKQTSEMVMDVLLRLKESNGFALALISHEKMLLKSYASRVFDFSNNCIVGLDQIESIINNTPVKRNNHISKDVIIKLLSASKSFKTKTSFLDFNGIKTVALNDIDLKVYQGEILGITGPSGSGKSTLGRIISMIDFLDQGIFEYQGIRIQAGDRNTLSSLRSDVQLIFQDSLASLNPKHTIRNALIDVLRTIPGLRSVEYDFRISEVLRQVSISEDLLDRFPRQLSGGQRQRFNIARVLLKSPSVLICDECISSLNEEVIYDILRTLVSLNQDLGMTIIFISHQEKIVNLISDRVLRMQSGRLLA